MKYFNAFFEDIGIPGHGGECAEIVFGESLFEFEILFLGWGC